MSAKAVAQGPAWTWMGGQSTMEDNQGNFIAGGVYGAKGVFAPGNTPGLREGPVTWIDKKGNLWLFGGMGADAGSSTGRWTWGLMNDLWEFNPATNQWAFIAGNAENAAECAFWQSGYNAGYYCGAPGIYGEQGVPSKQNTPGSRQLSVAWTDANGKFWLFGGLGFEPGVGQGYFNDLWRFDPVTLEWTWMGGSPTVPGYDQGQTGIYGTKGQAAPGNFPGGRSDAAGCTDASGNFWLFGGQGFSSQATQYPSYLADLWEFNRSSGEWTWVSGPNANYNVGIYGNKGTASPGSYPGGRADSACWFDKSGKLWLFGGYGYSSTTSDYNSYLNDFWNYSPASKEWTWVGGSDRTLDGGAYGNVGQPGTAFIPSARSEMARFTDTSGRFWLFGGRGPDSRGGYNWGSMNDLWMFDPSSQNWTWMSGTNVNTGGWFGVGGTYGIMGSPNPANTPGGRDMAAAWKDAAGNFWLFGGEGSGANGVSWGESPNDLWEYRITYVTHSTTPAPQFSVAPGSFPVDQFVTISDAKSNAAIYYSTTAHSTSPVWIAYAGAIEVTASEEITAFAVAPGMWPSPATDALYQLPTATPVIALPSGTYQAVTVKITCATPGATIYYTTNGSAPTANSTVFNGQIVLTASATVSAMAVAPGSLGSAVATATYTISSRAAATNQWTWMGGSATFGPNSAPQPGVYGQKGTAASGNTPGGRDGSMGWTDKTGNAWLFGGYGVDSAGIYGTLNDLWRLNTATGQWAWMGGSSTFGGKQGFNGVYGTKGQFARTNYPGSRDFAVTWVDKQGNFWLFGGYGLDGSTYTSTLVLNDLWEFNPNTREWAWIAGPAIASCPNNESGLCPQRGAYGTQGVGAPANVPGGRQEAVGWIDASGNLWLFGGQGPDINGDSGSLNELWEFDIAAKVWTWIGGQNAVGPQNQQPGVYGVRGVPDSQNYPGGRNSSLAWTDANGNFWLFAGWGSDATTANLDLNDLWEYNPLTGQWTWITGSDTVTGYWVPSVYGMLGVPSAQNTPGGRYPGMVWQDKKGNAWLFGGYGASSATSWGLLNDMWEFTPSTHEWAWMGGSSQPALLISYGESIVPGAYGILRKPAAGNTPGGRQESVGWTDANGNLWLFGGDGVDANGTMGNLNDLWKFQSQPPSPPAAAPLFSVPGGDYASAQTVKITDATSGAKIYYSTNGQPPTTGSKLYTGPIAVSQTTVIQAIAVAAGYSQSAATQEIYIIGQ